MLQQAPIQPQRVLRATNPRTFHVWTIGCQMNVAESAAVVSSLQRRGLRYVSEIDDAELVVLNSCTVRESAEQRVQGTLHRLANRKHRDADLMVALTGCSVEPDIDEMTKRMPMVDFFFKPGAIDYFIGQLEAHDLLDTPEYVAGTHIHSSSVTGYVPVMQGCNKFCTYCIVPYRRGREVSRPVHDVVKDVRDMVEQGVKEVTLLGQIIDHYGRDWPEKGHLSNLMRAVNDIDGIERIRFYTSHPRDMDDRLIDTLAQLPKMVETVHLPVQAGNDVVLRSMRRQYTVDHYVRLVDKIRTAIPGVAITTDIIVGFCGETDEQFQDTLKLMDTVQFDLIHAASYSSRRGAVSSSWPDDVSEEEKEARRRQLEERQKDIQSAINLRLMGSKLEVLVEDAASHRPDVPQWRGRTRTNKLVFIPRGDDNLVGRTMLTQVIKTSPWALQGVID